MGNWLGKKEDLWRSTEKFHADIILRWGSAKKAGVPVTKITASIVTNMSHGLRSG